MLTIEVKVNNVPTDRIDVVNITMHPPVAKATYNIYHYNFLAQKYNKTTCKYDRKKGRFALIEQVMKKIR